MIFGGVQADESDGAANIFDHFRNKISRTAAVAGDKQRVASFEQP